MLQKRIMHVRGRTDGVISLPAQQIKMIVVLGELGGRDEYGVVEALKAGSITKPLVAWVSGTCAQLFKSEVGPEMEI